MLYHYTSAKLLEKIIASGKLRPSGVRGWRLLWATSVPTAVDLTSAYYHEPIVARFTLHSCDFEPWADVRSRFQKEKRKRAERAEQLVLNNCGRYGTRPENWYVRYASLPADRWLRIDTRDQRWQPYGSSTWPKQGPPQLGMMPWYSRWDYRKWAIDLGDDPATMDAAALADYRQYIEAEQEDNDWCQTHKEEEEDWEGGEDWEEEENWDAIMEEVES